MIPDMYTRHYHGTASNHTVVANVRFTSHGKALHLGTLKVMREYHCFYQHTGVVSYMYSFRIYTVDDSRF